MQIFKIHSFQCYEYHKEKRNNYLHSIKVYLDGIIEKKLPFIHGYSYTAEKMVDFKIRYNKNGKVNWRETLQCPITNLNNRSRLSIFLIDVLLSFYEKDKVYISEQTTPMYHYIHGKYTHEHNLQIIGSEFLGKSVELGKVDSRGIRNENLTKLSFKDGEIDKILTFDVLEHIPDYKRAINECFRVLADKGKILISVPFVVDSSDNIVRAYLNENKNVVHIKEPEYHGNPISTGKGILCFYHFGWELLDDFRQAGFSNVYVILAMSKKMGNLGYRDQVMIIAEK